jgi:hypothetical protein
VHCFPTDQETVSSLRAQPDMEAITPRTRRQRHFTAHEKGQ